VDAVVVGAGAKPLDTGRLKVIPEDLIHVLKQALFLEGEPSTSFLPERKCIHLRSPTFGR
jgi:hypothetical protein